MFLDVVGLGEKALTKHKEGPVAIQEAARGRSTCTCTLSPGWGRWGVAYSVWPGTSSGTVTRAPSWRWGGLQTGTRRGGRNNLDTHTLEHTGSGGATRKGLPKTTVKRWSC